MQIPNFGHQRDSLKKSITIDDLLILLVRFVHLASQKISHLIGFCWRSMDMQIYCLDCIGRLLLNSIFLMRSTARALKSPQWRPNGKLSWTSIDSMTSSTANEKSSDLLIEHWHFSTELKLIKGYSSDFGKWKCSKSTCNPCEDPKA